VPVQPLSRGLPLLLLNPLRAKAISHRRRLHRLLQRNHKATEGIVGPLTLSRCRSLTRQLLRTNGNATKLTPEKRSLDRTRFPYQSLEDPDIYRYCES
jgi:hypothetical protein